MDNGASSYRRFLAGDNEGLAEIVREYSDGLIFYINSYVQNISLAEEIMEDVFVEIALKRPKYKEKSAFKTWLYAIARYISIDCLKKNSRYYDIPVDEMHNISDEQDLEKSYIREERKIQLHKVLSRLVPDYRQVGECTIELTEKGFLSTNIGGYFSSYLIGCDEIDMIIKSIKNEIM